MHWPTSLEDIGIVTIIGGVAIVANICGYLMKTMIPLRVLAMSTNVLFLIWSMMAGVYVTMILNSILLPINALRFFQMRRLIKQVNTAANSDLSMDWIKPFMRKRNYKKGAVLFRKGDVAQEMFYTVSGRYLVTELGVELPPGKLMGELGFLAPDNKRTQTVECLEDGEVLRLDYDTLRELYFQNPEFGFYFLRLTSERMLQNIARLERELEQHKVRISVEAAQGTT